MDVFIYTGKLWCGDCTKELKTSLDDDGKTPADVDNVFSYDSTAYPKGPYNELVSHMPQYCAGCNEFLENPLSDAGKEFLNKLADAIAARDTSPSDEELDLLNFYGLSDKLKRSAP